MSASFISFRSLRRSLLKSRKSFFLVFLNPILALFDHFHRGTTFHPCHFFNPHQKQWNPLVNRIYVLRAPHLINWFCKSFAACIIRSQLSSHLVVVRIFTYRLNICFSIGFSLSFSLTDTQRERWKFPFLWFTFASVCVWLLPRCLFDGERKEHDFRIQLKWTKEVETLPHLNFVYWLLFIYLGTPSPPLFRSRFLLLPVPQLTKFVYWILYVCLSRPSLRMCLLPISSQAFSP